MNRIRPLLVLALCASASRAGEAQSNRIAGGASIPIGDFYPRAHPGFGIAVLSESGVAIGPLDIRTDITFDKFGGKGTATRWQYWSAGVSLVKGANSGFYWLAGWSLYSASDQVTLNGRTVAFNHTNGGVKAGLGVTFALFRKAVFLEGNWVRLLASGREVVWVPVRFGFVF